MGGIRHTGLSPRWSNARFSMGMRTDMGCHMLEPFFPPLVIRHDRRAPSLPTEWLTVLSTKALGGSLETPEKN